MRWERRGLKSELASLGSKGKRKVHWAGGLEELRVRWIRTERPGMKWASSLGSKGKGKTQSASRGEELKMRCMRRERPGMKWSSSLGSKGRREGYFGQFQALKVRGMRMEILT